MTVLRRESLHNWHVWLSHGVLTGQQVWFPVHIQELPGDILMKIQQNSRFLKRCHPTITNGSRYSCQMFLPIHFEIQELWVINNNKHTNSARKFPGDFANFQKISRRKNNSTTFPGALDTLRYRVGCTIMHTAMCNQNINRSHGANRMFVALVWFSKTLKAFSKLSFVLLYPFLHFMFNYTLIFYVSDSRLIDRSAILHSYFIYMCKISKLF